MDCLEQFWEFRYDDPGEFLCRRLLTFAARTGRSYRSGDAGNKIQRGIIAGSERVTVGHANRRLGGS